VGHHVKITLMKNYRNKEVIIINADTEKQVNIGDPITSFRGEQTTVKFCEPPHKPSASGKVNGYYAGVYNLKYVEI
jgi:hypothetical protein